MFIKVLGLSIFTLATLITSQDRTYEAVIQWSNKGQYVIPGNDTIGNQLQLDLKEARYVILVNGLYSQIIYKSPGETRYVTVEGDKVITRLSNITTDSIIDENHFRSPANIKLVISEEDEECWQVNDSTMLLEIVPCFIGNEKQLFRVVPIE
ncbi:unnamed protein product [Cunninghamella blakesleeana]